MTIRNCNHRSCEAVTARMRREEAGDPVPCPYCEIDRLQRELKFLRGLVKERESAGNDIPPWLALEWIDTALAPSTDDAQG